MQRNIFAGLWARRTLPELLNIISEWHPDLLVRDNTEYAGCVAATAAGIPHAVMQIAGLGPGFLQNIDEPLRQLCDLAGVAPADPAALMYRYLLLLPRPFRLWKPDFPAPSTLHSFRYVGFSGAGDEVLPPWTTTLAGPTIYATLGTVANYATDVFTAILEGLRDEPANLILTVGRDRDPAEFGEQPANVRVERYIPQDLLLPHCDLVVTHGGSGTMLDALSHGIPMVMIPYAADQPLNARLCAQEGVARVVWLADHTGPGQLAQAIKEAARDVLGNPRYRIEAQRLRKEIDDLPGLEHAVALLERLIAERAPILAEAPASS